MKKEVLRLPFILLLKFCRGFGGGEELLLAAFHILEHYLACFGFAVADEGNVGNAAAVGKLHLGFHALVKAVHVNLETRTADGCGTFKHEVDVIFVHGDKQHVDKALAVIRDDILTAER